MYFEGNQSCSKLVSHLVPDCPRVTAVYVHLAVKNIELWMKKKHEMLINGELES